VYKLGPHIIRNTNAAMEWTRKAAIVKSIDDIGPLANAPEGAIRVYRRYLPDQEGLARASPQAVANAILTGLRGYNHPRLYVEVFNEYRQTAAEIAFHADVVEQVTATLHRAGYRVAGFSFSTGNPEPEVWQFLRSRGFCGVDAIALHEYWGMRGFSTWNALRYRRVHEWLGGQHPPFVITECGRDAVEGAEGRPGWQRQGVTGDQYVRELLSYAAELEKDGYVLGGTVFTCGPYSDFAGFDVDGLVGRIPPASQTISIPDRPVTGGDMDIITQYRSIYDQWVAAGGVVNNFRRHLLAIGILQPTQEDIRLLINEAYAANQQLKQTADRFFR